MEIRRVRDSDVKTFVDCYILSYRGLENYAYETRREVKNYFKWLMKRDPAGFMIAEENGKAIGFVACDTNWFSLFELKKVGELHEIFVIPSFRNKGVGSKLLHSAIGYAIQRGREVAELWVGEKNEIAKIFYERNGFKVAEKVGKWVRMIRKLN